MAIPKEPRQLMINVMYLVLTAMLALNVSAEIFNAFKVVDKGIEKSNMVLDESNAKLPQLIRDGAKKKASFATYAERISPSQTLTSNASNDIQKVINNLVDLGGDNNGTTDEGDYKEVAGKRELKGKKNKDVTTRFLVNEGVGEELKTQLMDYRNGIIELVDEKDRESFMQNIPNIIDDDTWKNSNKKSWAEFNFKQMPLQAALPILRKLQNDVKSTEYAFLNYLANTVGTTTDVVLDKFTVVSSPEKSYIINGESFKADIFLSAFAGGDSKTGISISANGKPLSVDNEGIATFTEKASGVGVKKYNAAITVTNPATGEKKTYNKTFEYEVGQRGAAISLDKMNVFYIGVDNPITTSVSGVSSNEVKLSGQGVTVNRGANNGSFVVRASRPGKASLTISAPGLTQSFDYRVKRIPDPIPMIGKKKGGRMGNGEFKAYSSLRAALDNFDFEARCEIKGFKMVYVPARQDPQVETNPGGKYRPGTLSLVSKAKPGDRYFYEDIKCTCPGDAAARDLGSLAVTIQ